MKRDTSFQRRSGRSRTPVAAIGKHYPSLAERLGGKLYRTGALAKIADQLDGLRPWDFVPPIDLVAIEKVKVDDPGEIFPVSR